MLFSLLKHYLDTALKVSQSLYCFTTSVSHGVKNYFPRQWGTGISDAILIMACMLDPRCKELSFLSKEEIDQVKVKLETEC